MSAHSDKNGYIDHTFRTFVSDQKSRGAFIRMYPTEDSENFYILESERNPSQFQFLSMVGENVKVGSYSKQEQYLMLPTFKLEKEGALMFSMDGNKLVFMHNNVKYYLSSTNTSFTSKILYFAITSVNAIPINFADVVLYEDNLPSSHDHIPNETPVEDSRIAEYEALNREEILTELDGRVIIRNLYQNGKLVTTIYRMYSVELTCHFDYMGRVTERTYKNSVDNKVHTEYFDIEGVVTGYKTNLSDKLHKVSTAVKYRDDANDEIRKILLNEEFLTEYIEALKNAGSGSYGESCQRNIYKKYPQYFSLPLFPKPKYWHYFFPCINAYALSELMTILTNKEAYEHMKENLGYYISYCAMQQNFAFLEETIKKLIATFNKDVIVDHSGVNNIIEIALDRRAGHESYSILRELPNIPGYYPPTDPEIVKRMIFNAFRPADLFDIPKEDR